MGGYGSTRWGWHTKAVTVEECRSIDIRNLKNEGLFSRPGEMATGSITWSNYQGEKIASVSFAAGIGEDSGKLALKYTLTNRYGPSVDISYTQSHCRQHGHILAVYVSGLLALPAGGACARFTDRHKPTSICADTATS